MKCSLKYAQGHKGIAYAGSDVDGVSVDFAGKYAQSQQTIKDRYADFEVPYNGTDNDDYVNGGGFCCDDNPKLRAGAIGNGNDNPEIYQYYYHSDHLGSTSLITDLDGDIVQHVEYVPFGEVFIEERNNKWNTPYLFNAKELDEETGLYYYGTRYYDPRVSLFLSVDNLAEQSPHQSGYIYCSNNPINRIDPDGNWDIYVHAYSDRAKGKYAVFIVKDRNGNEIYRTVVKTTGTAGRTRNVTNSDTPQGQYKILGYRKTGEGTNYSRDGFGPNNLLALDYQGGEGGTRNAMHVHGGRQEGRYEGRTDLADTHGCMRINDVDILELRNITTALEQNDPLEKGNFLTLTDDLQTPVKYSIDLDERHDVGTDQFPKVMKSQIMQLPIPSSYYVAPVDNTRVVIPYKFVIPHKYLSNEE